VPPQTREQLRRGSEEVRELMLAAARQEFSANGYSGATTKDIAARAAVSHRLLFSNFGSKADLFRQAMIEPFDRFTEGYVQAWRQISDDASPESRVEGFVRGLLDLVDTHRVALRSAIAHADTPGPEATLLHDVAAAFQRIHTLVLTTGEWQFEPAPVVAASAGAVMSTILLAELVFPDSQPRPSRDTLIIELTRFILYGISIHFDPPLHPPETKVPLNGST